MAKRISYNEVKENIESKGWTLKSNSYKNLQTDLTVLCPNGHENHITYENWRRRNGQIDCLICCRSPIKKINEKPTKKKGYRILAVD